MMTNAIKNIADGIDANDACSFQQHSSEVSRAIAAETALAGNLQGLQVIYKNFICIYLIIQTCHCP
jgi:hypothetical protein